MKWVTTMMENANNDVRSADIQEMARLARAKAERYGVKLALPDCVNRTVVIEDVTAEECRKLAWDLNSFDPLFVEFVPTGLAYIAIRNDRDYMSYLRYLELSGFAYVDFSGN